MDYVYKGVFCGDFKSLFVKFWEVENCLNIPGNYFSNVDLQIFGQPLLPRYRNLRNFVKILFFNNYKVI